MMKWDVTLQVLQSISQAKNRLKESCDISKKAHHIQTRRMSNELQYFGDRLGVEHNNGQAAQSGKKQLEPEWRE